MNFTRSIIFIFSLCSLITYTAKADHWVQKLNFPGPNRDWSFSFSIGNLAYIGCGLDTTATAITEFWEYNSVTDVWTRKADFPGAARWTAIGFSIGTKGYAGLGKTNSSSSVFSDFWQYDPSTNTWTREADFAGGARYVAIGFSIGNYGYAGLGAGNSSYNDLWKYDPVGNNWTQESSLTGGGIEDANCFVIGTNAYIVGGCYSSAMWEYNSVANTWSAKASLPAAPRCDAAAFSMCNYGYWGMGEEGDDTYGADLWEYSPTTNTWAKKASLPDSTRDEPICFVIGNQAYIGLGGRDGFATGIYYRDIWEYFPDDTCKASCNLSSPEIAAKEKIFCAKDSTPICAPSGYSSYKWNTNDIDSCVFAREAGDYYVTVTDNNGCTALSDTLTISLYPPPVDTIYSNTGIFCASDSALICAPGGYPSYQWNAGITGTGNCIYAKQAGNYYVTVTDANGCTAESNHISISVYPVPSVSIIREGDTLSSYGAVGYQWYFNNNPIPNATNPVYIAKEQGSYAVEITDTNGCTEISQPVSITGVNDLAIEPDVFVFPNPNSIGLWQLQVGTELIGSRLEVYDEEGQIVFKSEIRSPKSEITIKGLAIGIYYLRISNYKSSLVSKLVKE